MELVINTWVELDDSAQSALLARPELQNDAEVRSQVTSIIDAVRSGGDEAVRRMTERFDSVRVDTTRVSNEEIAAAREQLDETAIDAINLAITNVTYFHQQQVPEPIRVETMPGVVCERVSQPLDAVGLYVPAGSAPLPSAAIMLAVPAAIAGCPLRILCTPPRSDGSADPAVLVAASMAGITRIFKIGGAQAIAAMAYGTDTVPRVRKIFGPGNAWVTCAKALVSADDSGAAIDMPAGPSEVLVIADEGANAEYVAADLLSQAEHGRDSQVLLVTTSDSLALQVQTQIGLQLQPLSRAGIAREALMNSTIIVVDSVRKAIAISNRYAPEHLILQIANARAALDDIRNAGSVFVGAWSPESAGDYCSGTNHVLPTNGYAATYSGLGVDQFMRSMTIQELSRDGLESISSAVTTLAGLEGLDAHAAAVVCRLATRS